MSPEQPKLPRSQIPQLRPIGVENQTPPELAVK
jgi:hypothetical protein